MTVRVRLAGHIVALHDALESAALDGADDIDHLAGSKFFDRDDIAHLDVDRSWLTNLVEVTVRGDACLAQVPELATGEATLLLGAKGDLDGIIAIVGHGLDLSNRARAGLDDRNRDEVVLRVVNLGHSDFFTE